MLLRHEFCLKHNRAQHMCTIALRIMSFSFQVETLGERVVLYILNRVIYRNKEMTSEELPFLCHGGKDYAKILWKNGEAVGFYSVKLPGNLWDFRCFYHGCGCWLVGFQLEQSCFWEISWKIFKQTCACFKVFTIQGFYKGMKKS